MFESMLLFVFLVSLTLAAVGFLIGVIEKHRIEQKQEYLEHLERKQKQYYKEEQDYTNGLAKEKEAYERLLNELDRSTLPTKDQMKKLHWYMRHHGILDQQQQQRMNDFYDNNYPN